MSVGRDRGEADDLAAIVVELKGEKGEGVLDEGVGCGSHKKGGLLGGLWIKEAHKVEGIGFLGAKQIKADGGEPERDGVGGGLWLIEQGLKGRWCGGALRPKLEIDLGGAGRGGQLESESPLGAGGLAVRITAPPSFHFVDRIEDLFDVEIIPTEMEDAVLCAFSVGLDALVFLGFLEKAEVTGPCGGLVDRGCGRRGGRSFGRRGGWSFG